MGKCICPPGPPGPQGEPGPPGPEFSICDCCVSPLQNVLEQLVGETVTLATVADPPNVTPFMFLVVIDAVNDYLITVIDETTNITTVVNIADVTGVGFLPGPEIQLEPPVDFPGECNCIERPLRELFNTLIDSTVDVRFNQGTVLSNISIERIGLGIVFGELDIGGGTIVKIAMSLCKITQVNSSAP